MAEQDPIADMMFEELMGKRRDDFDGAQVKLVEWRGLIDVLEKLLEVAREHPDGWQHVAKMFTDR